MNIERLSSHGCELIHLIWKIHGHCVKQYLCASQVCQLYQSTGYCLLEHRSPVYFIASLLYLILHWFARTLLGMIRPFKE